MAAAKARGVEVRGPSDHGFIRSTYFRDPNGYVVELAVKTPVHTLWAKEAPTVARELVDAWTKSKAGEAALA